MSISCIICTKFDKVIHGRCNIDCHMALDAHMDYSMIQTPRHHRLLSGIFSEEQPTRLVKSREMRTNDAKLTAKASRKKTRVPSYNNSVLLVLKLLVTISLTITVNLSHVKLFDKVIHGRCNIDCHMAYDAHMDYSMIQTPRQHSC